LEIGRRHGASTVLLLAAAGPTRTVTSIDIKPDHRAECQTRFDQIQSAEPQRLRLVIGDSRKPLASEKFGFAFIDGDHSYAGVKADTVAHWAEIESFADRPPMLVYHDAVPNPGLSYKGRINHCEGVTALCRELVESKSARVIETAGSSMWLEKLAELPANF
jgi:predicted O-methyltransferase YrrM